MPPRPPLSRRKFLAGTAAAMGTLVIGLRFPEAGGGTTVLAPNAWLRLTSDDRITVLVEKPELGQGARTYTAMLIAEELEVDVAAIEVEQAPTDTAVYRELRTGGSAGLASVFLPMRRAGAEARERLLAAAATGWQVDRAECRAERGTVVHTATGRRLRYGALVETASRLPPPDPDSIPLKQPKDFRVIGRPVPRTDVPCKVDGSARFGIDVRLSGMLYAVIARCPAFGRRLTRADSAAARAVPGVRAVFEVPPLPRHYNTAGGVAVVADSTWGALQGRKALRLEWEPGSAEDCTERLGRLARERAAGPPTFVAVDRGDAPALLARLDRVIRGHYESPFQAHATLEPMNTTVHVRPGGVEVWSPTQFADEIQSEIAALSGLPAAAVTVHMTLSGGSFGRRYQWDYAAEAWQVAREMKAPVQLLWTREDDLQHDFYRPYNYQTLSAAVDGKGLPVAWATRIVTTPIAGTNLYTSYRDSAKTRADPATVAALEWFGADVAPYAIPNIRVDYAPLESAVPRSWWRSVSSSYTHFAKECFIDELAHAAHRDPLAFRLALLPATSADATRVRRVLTLAAARAGWGRPLAPRQGRGIACRFGASTSAQVAEVAVAGNGSVQVLKVTSVVDCGIPVNPDAVRAQTEGAINFGLTAVLNAEITVTNGAVDQSNFHDYPVLRLSQAPEVDTHIVPGTGDPSGVGELGVMLVGPAVANAVFAATGVRVRRLPIDARLLGGAS